VKDIAQQALEIAGVLLRMPKRVDALVTRIEDGSVAVTNPRLEQRVARLERTARRVVSALLFGALLVAGAVVRADDVVLGSVLMVASVVPLLYTLFGGRRSP
jgi:hypothetical protein